ncbi:FAD-binding domain-containing protein [Panus rudis PR-1116 ss-1]|nr:FAD-binding domain-containing protein [Panus rudis PR-1116 ss-1]
MLLSPFLLLLAAVLPSNTAPDKASCKCRLGDPCWPSDAEFAKLASQLSQPLIHPLPPASACYPISNPSGNCTEVLANWQNYTWHADQPGSMQSPNFETFIHKNGSIEACYGNVTLGLPCQQGSVPVLGVDARSLEDIQTAVKFAGEHNLKLVIKNTGHDYLGRSVARKAFMIWTHHRKNITVHPTFTPDGAPSSEVYENAITLESGVQWHEAYDAASAAGVVLVGGVTALGTVGAAGGWIQGGGHSALSPTYGLGVDNVVQMTAVLANGTHVTANAHQNADLFWALRGGGGGTFGVVTSVTYQTRPTTPVIAALFKCTVNGSSSGTPPILTSFVAELLRAAPALTDAGWGGYTIAEPTDSVNSSITFLGIAPNVSWEKANETMIPFFDRAASVAANSSTENGVLTITDASTFPMDSFQAWFAQFIGSGSDQVANIILGSRLLPKDVLEQNADEVAATLVQLPLVQVYLVAGGAVSRKDPSSAALTPAWRKAAAHTVFGYTWPDGTNSTVIDQYVEDMKSKLDLLHSVAPDSGAYFNEASLYERDFKQTFFGSHYDELRAVKTKYDPQSLFLVPKGVASDEWDDALVCKV